MKTIVINASPRTHWNTAKLMEAAKQGAQSAGDSVESVDLYRLNFSGCQSCLVCKQKGSARCQCFLPDDLSPLIDRILHADNLIIGTPIYFGEPTSAFRALLERLLFCIISYDGEGSYFKGKVNVALVYTMNSSRQQDTPSALKNVEDVFGLLNGSVCSYSVCNTLQVADYQKYSMSVFNEAEKKAYHEAQFPVDLAAVAQLAASMGRVL